MCQTNTGKPALTGPHSTLLIIHKKNMKSFFIYVLGAQKSLFKTVFFVKERQKISTFPEGSKPNKIPSSIV